jgi:lipopolysaccharide/colanic/teichoic acid biosynthesis glycosyltransferase
LKKDAMQRAIDIAGAALLLVILSPVLMIIGLAVRLTSPGPAIYRAIRIGRHGRPFELLKFRTMVQHASDQGPAITRAGDPRVTAVGRLLRKTKLDELPQLWNVLNGEMSLVGPRPEDPRYVRLYTIDELRDILSVRPGITGPSQLVFRHEEEMLATDDPEASYIKEILPRKLAIDRNYARSRSVPGDLAILAKTARALCDRSTARPVAGVRSPDYAASSVIATEDLSLGTRMMLETATKSPPHEG